MSEPLPAPTNPTEARLLAAEAKVRELHTALSEGYGVEDGGIWEDRALAAEKRVGELEDAEEFHRDPLDPGSYAHTILMLEGRIGELEALLERWSAAQPNSPLAVESRAALANGDEVK